MNTVPLTHAARWRIGFRLEHGGCPEWVARLLGDVAADGRFEVAWIGRESDPPLLSHAAGYAAWDRARVASAPDPLGHVTFERLLQRYPALSGRVAKGEDGPANGLDVVLDFGHGGASPAARLGVWSFRLGGARLNEAGEYGVPELLRGATFCQLDLITERGDEGTLVLSRTFGHVNDASLWRTRAPALWKARAIALRALSDLARLGPEAFLGRALARQGRDVPQAPPPVSVMGMRCLKAKLLFRRLLTPYRLVREQWRVGVRVRPPAGQPDAPWGSKAWARGFRFVDAPFDRFYADPFLFEHEGRTWLFVEDWDWQVGKAIISAAPLAEDGTLGAMVPALERPYHLSNPLVFAEGGEIYMIPETMAARQVEVYRCLEFPGRWELVCTPLTDLDIADACVLRTSAGWLMLASVAYEGGLGWDELHVFRADALCGPWTPDPDNPVVSDVRTARPGGRMWEKEGRLFRLAQDSAGRYGSGLGLFEVSPDACGAYRQERVAALNSFDFAMNGVHAYDSAGRFEVVDGRHYQLALGRWRAYWPLPRWLGRA